MGDKSEYTVKNSGMIKLFQAREILVSDIPAGDGKMDNLFTVCSPPNDERKKLDLTFHSTGGMVRSSQLSSSWPASRY
jgi:hypothetical protein